MRLADVMHFCFLLGTQHAAQNRKPFTKGFEYQNSVQMKHGLHAHTFFNHTLYTLNTGLAIPVKYSVLTLNSFELSQYSSNPF